jgi:hypothetical protein
MRARPHFMVSKHFAHVCDIAVCSTLIPTRTLSDSLKLVIRTFVNGARKLIMHKTQKIIMSPSDASPLPSSFPLCESERLYVDRTW